MERRRSSDVVILWYSPYGILDRDKSSNGVNDLFQEGKPHIESKGFQIISVAPRVGDNSLNVADYNLGHTLTMPPWVTEIIGTSVPFSLPYRKEHARKLIEQIEPDFLFLEEPTQGFGAHGFISGMPKREDGKSMAIEIARFHAGIYNQKADAFFKFLLTGEKGLKRPQFHKNGLPNGKLTPGMVNTLLNSLERRIAVSKATAVACEKRFKDNKEYKIVYNGINTKELNPEGPIIEEWKKDGKDIVLCAPGRHEPRKGIKYAIKAFSIIRREKPNTKLIIAGEGKDSETSKLEAMVKKMGLKDDVKFVGRLSRENYVKALRTADICICPAVGGEGFGRVVVEPLGVGTSVVLSDIAGFNEAVDGGRPFALMTQPRDTEDIAKKALEILNRSKDVKEKFKSEAALYVRERFAWPIIAQQLTEILDEAYQKHGGVDWSKWEERKIKPQLPVFGDIFVR